MKICAVLVLTGCAFAATPATIVDCTFANGNSQLQDIPNNSLWLFNGRANTVRTDAPGSVNFDITNAGGSEAFWAYFTPAGLPVSLDVGEKLSVSVTFSLSGFTHNGQDVRWGVLDSQGSRNTTNLTGGMNDSTFVNDTGYGLDFAASGNSNPFVLARRTNLTSANVFNSFADFTPIPGAGATETQPLVDDVPYTLIYTIERLSATDTRLSAAVTGGTLSGLNYTAVESSPAPNNSFDYFAFRIGGTNFTTQITFTELLVEYVPAAPAITSQPQLSSLTVQVGSSVTMAVGARGNSLVYQWVKDGSPLSGNDSAATPTLRIANAQHADAGSYTALISNAGGSVSSNAVKLSVSDSAVPPPPTIVTQPANTTVTLGKSASLSVGTRGDNLFYQWFKNGTLVPGATATQLTFANAQVSDSASYDVVVSNASGSVASASATLLVVSAMLATSVSPYPHQTGVRIDTPLSITFDQAPQLGTRGRIQIFNSHGTLLDAIDMSASPQTKTIGGQPFAYYPVIITGNTAAIYLHQYLPYSDSYYVTVDPGVVTDPAGAPYSGFADTHLWTFTVTPPLPLAIGALTVGPDCSGEFCTVQGAIDFVPPNLNAPVTIRVGPGTYTEIVYVPSNKPFLTVQGQDRERTIIQYANNNSLNPSTTTRAMFGVDAPDFTLRNITLWNTTPHGGSQAEAFRGNGARILLDSVNLKSYQDTLLLQGSGFVTDSTIEGDVDFMWGAGAVYFQDCELKAATAGGYYTQIRNGQGGNGNVYVNCRLTAADGVSGSYLARIDPTVFPYSQVVYIKCAMGDHIAPAGWLLNNATSAPNVAFWEYGSTGLDGAVLDVSQRLRDSRQISAGEAAQWSDPGFVLGGWVPFTVNAVERSGTVEVHWSAPVGHHERDWIGLFRVGDPDSRPVARQYTGGGTTGRARFVVPAARYEARYFLRDGFARAGTGNLVTAH